MIIKYILIFTEILTFCWCFLYLSISISCIFILITIVSSVNNCHESIFNEIFFDNVNCKSSCTSLFLFLQWIIDMKPLVSVLVQAMRCWTKIYKSMCLHFLNSLIWNIWQQAFNYYRNINHWFSKHFGNRSWSNVITTFSINWCYPFF